MSLRDEIIMRAGRRCEVEIEHPSGGWIRCSHPATDVHHMLTKARGGRALDRARETYHLIALCRTHHNMCDGEQAYELGLLIEGSAQWDKVMDRPVYTGPDEYLTEKYPPRPRTTWYPPSRTRTVSIPIDG